MKIINPRPADAFLIISSITRLQPYSNNKRYHVKNKNIRFSVHGVMDQGSIPALV